MSDTIKDRAYYTGLVDKMLALIRDGRHDEWKALQQTFTADDHNAIADEWDRRGRASNAMAEIIESGMKGESRLFFETIVAFALDTFSESELFELRKSYECNPGAVFRLRIRNTPTGHDPTAYVFPDGDGEDDEPPIRVQ